MISSYKDLEVYHKAYKLAISTQRLTTQLPRQESYEIGSQIRRASMSIVLNIVEGYGRKDSAAEFKHFLRNALGSCNETRVLIDMLKDLGHITEETWRKASEEYEILSKQIYRLKETWTKDKF